MGSLRLLALISLLAVSLTKSYVLADNPLNISQNVDEIRRHLEKKKDSLALIDSQVQHLEGQLGQHGEEYLRVMRIKSKIEGEILELNKNIKNSSLHIETQLERIEQVLKLKILNRFESTYVAASVIGEHIIGEILVENYKNLLDQRKTLDELKLNLAGLEERYREYNDIQLHLTSLLQELERERDVLGINFTETFYDKNSLEEQFKKLKEDLVAQKFGDSTKARKKVNGIIFSLPIDQFLELDHAGRGVTFKFSGRRNVLNAAAGKIVHVGPLSTYGQVIMVDHGNDTRSVYLGNFSPKITNGKHVEKGQIIGHTLPTGENQQAASELYFEVRKHSEVQNTVLLLDRDILIASAMDVTGV